MKQLGKLTTVPIRSIWKKEPEFSAWLAEKENISLLGEEIGVEILAEETEAGVGDFSADILAKEDGGERLVIIENQYGNTDHDHLGKLITYAAGRGAKVLVWVVEKPRDEHRAAVQWLNDNTAVDIGVFLVQIEIYAIGIHSLRLNLQFWNLPTIGSNQPGKTPHCLNENKNKSPGGRLSWIMQWISRISKRTLTGASPSLSNG